MKTRDAERSRRLVTGCATCGVVFTNPLPAPEALTHMYAPDGPWAESRPDKATHTIPSKHVTLLKVLGDYVPVMAPSDGAKVLDYGCGSGGLLDALATCGWETYGIEPSRSIAGQRHRQLQAAPRDGTFDLAMLNHVLEHVRNSLAVLTEVAESLKPGAFLYVSVPRLDTLPEHRNLRYCLNGHAHLFAFSEACLRTLCAMAGLVVIHHLDARRIDELMTHGRPVHLRLIAVRGAAPMVRRPLRPAIAVLRAYASRGPQRLLPIRARAGWSAPL